MLNFMKGSVFSCMQAEPVPEEPEKDAQVLAVWGSPSSGKTTVSVRLAKYLAEQKKNVALLLCDMTTPMLPCICPPGDLECERSLVFKELKHRIDSFFYHFWTHAMPKLSRKTPTNLAIVTCSKDQQLIARATRAIEGLVNIGHWSTPDAFYQLQRLMTWLSQPGMKMVLSRSL